MPAAPALKWKALVSPDTLHSVVSSLNRPSGDTMLTSTSRGLSVARQVRGVPQLSQKWRSAFAEERYAIGSPAVTVKAVIATVSQATAGAPWAADYFGVLDWSG